MATNNTRQILASPGSVKGFMSARAPLSLPQGFVYYLYDARLDDGSLRVRWGSLSINAAVNSAQAYRGSFECSQNGTSTIFVATSDGANHVTILKSVDGGTTFTSVSPSVGTYGDTRLTDPGTPVYFTVVNDSGTDYVIIQNGVDNPRIYSGSVMAISIATTTAPAGSLSIGFVSQSNLAVVTTVTDSDATKQDGALVVTGTGSYMQVIVKPAWTAGQTSLFQSTTIGTLETTGQIGQFIWMVDEPTEQWRNLKIELRAFDGTYYTLYDPATDAVVTEATASGTTVLVGSNTLSRSSDSSLAGKEIFGYRFTWVGVAPAANVTINIYMVANGGYILGGTNYGAAYSATGSRVQGPATIFTNPTAPYANGIQVPVSQLFGYVYTTTVTTPSVLPFVGGTSLNYYRNDIGTTGYYQYHTRAVAVSTTYTWDDGVASVMQGLQYVDFSLPMPEAGTTAMPIGTAMVSVNDRLMVCSGNRFWYSWAGRPFNFTKAMFSDALGVAVPDSGGSFKKDDEVFMTIVAVGSVNTGAESLGTPQQGAVTVYPITDRTCYVLSGWDALSLNKTTPICDGTLSPLSAAQTSSGFFFLDNQQQIRKVTGDSSTMLSKYTVDNNFRQIPSSRLIWVTGATIAERYFMGYTPLGQTTNTQVSVYNEALGFESIDRTIYPAQGLLPYYSSTLARTRLLLFSQTQLIEHNAYGQTTEVGGSRPVMRVIFPEKEFPIEGVNAGKGYLLGDVDSGGTAALSIVNSTGTRVGTVAYVAITLAAPADSPSDTKAGRTFTPGEGASAITVQPIIDISALGGYRVYRVELEFSPSTQGYRL